ncbi:MAG: ATP synthase F1 subunit epsilon [Candidatus Levyibacteriota bacterium]|nr:MAG: ATP synthase F1 subunit epsilon [Candidatus Levybacteria bacterium]
MTFSFEIITPEKIVFKEEVNEVIVPTASGQITILPHHINLLTQIAEGEIIVKNGAKEQYLAVTGGFLEVSKNKVSLLADYAVRSEEIEIAKAEAAQKRAEKLMQEKVSERDFAIAETEFKRSLLELKVASRRRRKL